MNTIYYRRKTLADPQIKDRETMENMIIETMKDILSAEKCSIIFMPSVRRILSASP